jgi:hypothetical protein
VQERGASAYSVTLERGTDGTYLAWVDELPGCAVRGSDRDHVLDELRSEIPRFLRWAGLPQPSKVEVKVSDEVESAIETDEDTEVLVERDRAPLTVDDWEQLQAWLDRSRGELQALLREADLDAQRPGTERTAREEIEHVGFVELMYAMWTFDLQSRDGLARFLDWTRDAAVARMTDLADRGDRARTWAEWAGAPRPEPWTPRKAARRLLWHELLHLRALARRGSPGPPRGSAT